MNDAPRAFSKRLMERTRGVPPNGVQAAPYSAVGHFLRAVQAADTVDGLQVVAQMKRMLVEDFWSDHVPIREDGQVLRPMYMTQAKTPAQSTSRYDIFSITGDIPPSEAWRPPSESACPFIRQRG